MAKFNLEIDYEIMDEITRQNLKEAYRHADPDDDQMRNAVDLVLEYFSNEDEWKTWLKEKETL
jgi:hypothetical protein